jgi:hypothetical protein
MSVEVVPCSHSGCVDLIDSRGFDEEADPMHFTASQWAEFISAVKAGKYDNVGEA